MSRFLRPLLRLVSACIALGAVAALPAPAAAAQRLESFDLPSTQGNIDLAQVQLNKATSLRANVLLPDGYDQQPTADWPVLYLLAGTGDNTTGWITSGQIQTIARGLPAIVVMPESGKGFLMDWWNGGARQGQNWTRYMLDEVVPTIETRYRVRPGRQNHAIGGISMGGYGALLLGGQLPSYFGTIISLSSLVDSQNPESYAALPSSVGAPSYEAIWGPVGGAYATVYNPVKTVENVAASRIYLHTGNGFPDPFVPFNADAWTKGVAIEGFALAQNVRYAALLFQARVQHTFKVRVGVHDWPYWRRELPRAIQWGLFNRPPVTSSASATRWLYKTMAPRGNAWGLGYRFADPTTTAVTIERDGNAVKATGTGTITITPGAADWDASGAKPECSFTARMPVVRTLPAGCL
jgi:diacylglycerol O-acyltransferase/trehalose O-mycolyltransferase